MTPDAERLGLWLLLGRRVQGTATLTGRRRTNIRRLTCLHDVELDEGVEVDHLWCELPPYLERLDVGLRFRFDALVAQYARADGSEDVTLAQVRILSKVRG